MTEFLLINLACLYLWDFLYTADYIDFYDYNDLKECGWNSVLAVLFIIIMTIVFPLVAICHWCIHFLNKKN